MNQKYILMLSLLILATTAAGPTTARHSDAAPGPKIESASATEQTREALEKFYKEYAGWMSAGPYDEIAKPALPLDAATRRKVEKVGKRHGFDLLLRAQDFNRRALSTITVTPVDGEWYAAAYLDTYNKRRVVVPVRATMRKGQLVITDIALP